MSKKTNYQKLIEPKIQKLLEDIEKIKKISLTKDYTLDDVKAIDSAIKSASNKLTKSLVTNLDDTDTFSFDVNHDSEKEVPKNIQNSSDQDLFIN